MAPSKRRIDEIGEESRRRILDAAQSLFVEKGYEKTTFIDIAKRSGISRGSIPWHFKNKEGLLIAVAERAMERAYPDYAGVAPTPRKVMDDFVGVAKDTGAQMLLVLLTEALRNTGPLSEQYVKWLKANRKEFRRWFGVQRPDGVDRDWARTQEDRLSTVLVGALLGIQMQWQVDPSNVDLEGALHTLAGILDSQLRHLWDQGALVGET